MSEKSSSFSRTPQTNPEVSGGDALPPLWSAKTQKIITEEMRVQAVGILKTTDGAEEFLKRAGIVTRKGKLARAYR